VTPFAQQFDALDQICGERPPQVPVWPEHRASWIGTALSIAGHVVLVHEQEFDGIIEVPAVTPIPATKPWVMGVGTHKGEPLPIFNSDVFFTGKPKSGAQRGYGLLVQRPGFHFAMTISGIVGDRTVDADSRVTGQPFPADIEQYCSGSYEVGGVFMPVLDLGLVLGDPEFSQAAARLSA